MGPNWIHGTSGNPIMRLAEKTGTRTVEPEEDGDVFDAEGRRMGKEEAQGVGADVWEGVAEAFVVSDREGERIGVGDSLYGWFEERFEGIRKRGEGRWKGLGERDGRERLRRVMDETRMWGPFVGESVERQSLKFFWMEECIDGGNVFVADTYRKIVEEVARPVLESGVVRFGKEVTRIEMLNGDEGVRLTARDVTEGRREVVSEVFDEVICTAPLGWLKRHKKTAFSPPLPTRIDRAIDNISYGRLEKLYISFPHAFWLDSPSSSHTSSSSSTNSSTTSSLSSPTPNSPTTDDPTRPLALFTHFHHPSAPSYHPLVPPSQSPPQWNQNLVSLAHLPPASAHPTLLFYIYGDCASYVVHSVKNLEPHSKEYYEALWNFAQPFIAKLPGYEEGKGECVPVEKGLLCTQWQADPYAGNGSYACFLTGLEDGDGDIKAMREGEGTTKERVQEEAEGERGIERDGTGPRRGGLWLAGEHTAPVVALGTTTGAWWSGEGVARRICRKWGVEIVEDQVEEHVVEKEDKERLASDIR
jgi:hypothetical protein